MTMLPGIARRTFVACLPLALAAAGCTGLWDGTRYETYRVSPEQVTTIKPLDLRAMEKEKPVAEPGAAPGPGAPEKPPAEKPPAEFKLGIADCRALALENNLALKVQLFSPEIERQGVSEAAAAFEPYAFSSLSFVDSSTPTSLTLEASESETMLSEVGLRIPLRTGGEIAVRSPLVRNETNNIFSTLNPSYSTDFSVAISQPLLRGGGFRTATHPLRIARYNYQASQAHTRLEVIRVLAAVDRVYWRLYAARQELLVRKQEYDLAVAQLERATRMVNAQEVEEIEIFRAEEAAAQRLENIIIAENAIRDRERELKQVVNRPGMGVASPTVVIPTTVPSPVEYTLDRERLLAHALKDRMELVELELAIAADTSTIEFAENELLPILSASYTYNINALGAAADDAYDLLLENRFADHRAGLYLQIPIGNEAARSRLRRALAARDQRIATKAQRELLISNEVMAAADQLEANWQRVLASRKSTTLAQRTLAAEQRRFVQGLQTSVEVLNAQARFADAQSAEIAALIEYEIAQVDLAYAAGSLLGATQVVWDTEENTLSTK